MARNLNAVNKTLLHFEELVRDSKIDQGEGPLRVGVDLGTANIVISVVDSLSRPVAGISTPSKVVRDGIVVDYAGAVSA